jgi:REP-associated tyrosine transposase
VPQSLSNVTIHIIFSTRDRIDFLDDNIRIKTQAYIATILRDMKSFVHRVGGTENHIHIACTLPRTLSQSDFLNKLKSTSSKWLKSQGIKDFYWQSGFGVFSVSQSHIDLLIQYIDNQMKHHKTKSFKDEFRDFLHKYRIKYDEQYVWD